MGRQGLDAFRRSKMVILDHKPVRQDWWYPYPDAWFRNADGSAGGRKHSDEAVADADIGQDRTEN